jgi:hypothetical protein
MAERDIPRTRTSTGLTFGDEEVDEVLLDHPSVMSEKQRNRRYRLNIQAPSIEGFYQFWRRFTRHGKKNIGVMQSLRAFALSSCICVSPISRVMKSSVES